MHSLAGQRFCRFDGGGNHDAVGDDGQVPALDDLYRPAELEPLGFVVQLHCLRPTKSEVDGPPVGSGRVGSPPRRYLVGRNLDDEAVERPHEGDILQRLGRLAVRSGRQAGMGRGKFDIRFGLRDHDPELIETATRREYREATGEGDPATGCQASGDADQVLLANADVEPAIGVLLAEFSGHGRLREIRIQDDHSRVLVAELDKRGTVRLTRRKTRRQLMEALGEHQG